jgi:hypothetical protein
MISVSNTSDITRAANISSHQHGCLYGLQIDPVKGLNEEHLQYVNRLRVANLPHNLARIQRCRRRFSDGNHDWPGLLE